jgi:hypothetical protein
MGSSQNMAAHKVMRASTENVSAHLNDNIVSKCNVSRDRIDDLVWTGIVRKEKGKKLRCFCEETSSF